MKTLAIQHKNTYFVKTNDGKYVLQITPNSHRIFWYTLGETFKFENPIEIEITNKHTIEVILNGETSDFIIEKKQEKVLQEIENQKIIQQERENRKTNLINLWNFRKGKTDVFRITTGIRYNNEKNYSDEILSVEFIFGETDAYKTFNELKGSQSPDENEQYFFVEIASLYEGSKWFNRLEITSLEDFKGCDFDNIDTDLFAPSIENCDFIVTESQSHWSKPVRYSIEQRRGVGFWGSTYHPAQLTTADLNKDQTAYSETEIYESENEDLIKAFVETGYANKEIAKECMSEMDFDWYFSETQQVEED